MHLRKPPAILACLYANKCTYQASTYCLFMWVVFSWVGALAIFSDCGRAYSCHPELLCIILWVVSAGWWFWTRLGAGPRRCTKKASLQNSCQ